MVTFDRARGVIFDVDDTLLNNMPVAGGPGLHEISRFAAIGEVARRRSLDALSALTPAQNHAAFLNAPAHSLDSTIWTILRSSQLVPDTDIIDFDNELFVEIVELKHELHGKILAEQGRPIAGAPEFVRRLHGAGLTRMSIASTAIRRDIDIALSFMNLTDLFPPDRIIAREQLTHPKPDPESFNLAFELLGLPEAARAYTWAFEDDPRGIMAARSAGLFVCAITTRYAKADLMALPVAPDVVADSFAEFSSVLAVPET